ncbi:MAG TPA: hypothetical protein VF121_16290 [Thermoanaerobaculia bacterium]|nr:hypothetical protein [Thermoanaerobaculia bacterium]
MQGIASADAMQELNRRLVEGRVGFQKGECRLADLAAIEYEYEIT